MKDFKLCEEYLSFGNFINFFFVELRRRSKMMEIELSINQDEEKLCIMIMEEHSLSFGVGASSEFQV